MNDVLVLRQKSSEEGPDDPDNVLVLRQKSSEDRMILPDTPQRCGLPHHRHPLSPKTVVERGWRGYSISFLSRYPRPSYDFSRPPVSTDTEEHWRTLDFDQRSIRGQIRLDTGEKTTDPQLPPRPPSGRQQQQRRTNKCVPRGKYLS